jgi:hypothetical protein
MTNHARTAGARTISERMEQMNRRIRRKKVKQFKQRLQLVEVGNPYSALIWSTLYGCKGNEKQEYQTVKHYCDIFRKWGKAFSHIARITSYDD